LLFAIVAGLAITAWDLFLDPQMVAWGMWRWEAFEGAGYFGIPWLNYAGWWLVAGLMTMSVRPRPLGAATVPLLWVYGLVAALEAGGLGLFWGLPGPALSGLAGMGACLGLALWRRSAAAKAEARA
jgi:putative membrane protein